MEINIPTSRVYVYERRTMFSKHGVGAWACKLSLVLAPGSSPERVTPSKNLV